MADRTVAVNITAKTAGFTAGMSKVSASAKSTAASVKAAFSDSSLGVSKTATLFDRVGSSIDKGFAGVGKHKQSINTLSNGLLAIGVTAGVGVGLAVKKFAEFDSAMSSVAATGADARNNLDQLRDAAIKAGADTKFSATEAAGGVEALAKAGVSAKDTLGGGLSGALNLAAAGNQSVAESAETAASAMNQFGLSGKDVPHIADLLAQAAGTAQGEVSDMAAALNQSGLVAHQFGLSIDETAQTLALFAKNGLVGSDAGTSFKTMLTSLYAPTGNAANALDKLGVSAYDSSGAIKDINPLADELKSKLDALSEQDRNQALKNIFGADAIRAGTILLKDGSAGLSQMATDFGKFGTAADVARTKMDNLNGDLEQLKGSFETALIGLGEGGSGPLRSLVQGLTDVVNAFNDLGDGGKAAVLGVIGSIGGLALTAGVVGKVAIAANEAKVAFQGLGITAKGATIATAGIGAVIGLAALAFGKYAQNAAASRARVDDFTQALQSQTSAVQANVTAVAAKQLQDAGAFGAARQLGLSLDTVTQAALGNAGAMDQVGKAVGDALAKINTPQEFDANTQDSIAAAQVLQDAVGKTGSEYNKGVQNAKDFAAATGQAGAAASGASGPVGDVGKAAGDSADKMAELIEQSYALQNAMLQLSGSAIGVEAAIDAASKAAKDNGKNLNINTEKGRANQQALNSLAQATIEYTSSLVKAGASSDSVNKANERGRSAWIKNAESMGKSRQEAESLASTLFALPANVKPTIAVAGAELSKKQAADVNKGLKDIPKEKRAEIITIAQTKGAKAAKAAMEAVKDKTVIAHSKGDLKGAKQVDAAMKALKDRLVLAKARGDDKGARQIKSAMAALRDRSVTAHTKPDLSGVNAVRSGMGGLHDKTVTVTTIYNRVERSGKRIKVPEGSTGGYFTGSRFRYSDGGAVFGPGSGTSDEVPAWLSNGEYVIRAAAVKAVGLAALHQINAQGYATGGQVAAAGVRVLPPAGVDFARLWSLVRALTQPFAEIVRANAAVVKATAAKAAADAKIAKPKATLDRAVKATSQAKDRQEVLRDRVNRLKKEADATKGITKADRDLKRARNELSSQNAKVTKLTRDQTQASAAYTKVSGPAKEAAEKLAEAQRNLADAQKQYADQARAASEELSAPFRSKSHDIDDWLDSMKQGATDLKAFQGQIASLRKMGLSETLIQQISDQGATVGQELADQILKGGKKLADSLNKANGNLQNAADGLGFDITAGLGRYASGGFVSGPGSSVSDSINARLSDGEYVVNARATAAHRSVLDAINYGRSKAHPSFLPGFAQGGQFRHSYTKHIHGGDVHAVITSPDPDTIVRKIANRQRDSQTLAGLSRAI